MSSKDFIASIGRVVGKANVLTSPTKTRRYRTGFRYGGGDALAVILPGTLLEMWRVLQACHAEKFVIICQAANTGLTGGSTPVPEGYGGRPVVIINAMRLSRLKLIADGKQIISQPGVTLNQLEKALRPLGREPHSVIGSSCIGASVTGGICNNSGGSLIQRGPAYTQLALYAQIDENAQLRLVNHLGIDLGSTPEEILGRLDAGEIPAEHIRFDADRHASDHEYSQHVRDVESSSPARYNGDPRRLYEASGSAGKLAVFAVRLDTFAADKEAQVFYIGSNDPAELESLRRDILTGFKSLPIAGEYMHRSAYDLSKKYGKDLFLFIQKYGTDKIPLAFGVKSRFDGICEKFGLKGTLSDHLLQFAMRFFPDHMPRRLNEFRDKYEHHLLLKMGGDGIEEARNYLKTRFPSQHGSYIECNDKEGGAAFLNRFAVGGGVTRYRAVHSRTVEDILALDIALPRNTQDWFERLPPTIASKIEYTMYCGHFFCHVLHQEYLVKKGEDCEALKKEILERLDRLGAKYPAEHNVGQIYAASCEQEEFFRRMDPTNSFNPGVGKTSLRYAWANYRE
ncbi:D-lactate dehydrogenase [Paraburkholderia fungorum]|uniref:Quinone-dependent D-lactate dehydrogenase n=1 Tax=Paraburkholderia fungorum TaxID=134537 RepID=A0A1H1JQY3_9BURK|nr:D-lactate dehydrogenase [Paraburkholderia fungorum]SDR52423.1 D-lactate dehydrogenase [Paraburkholderia fungorum]